MLVLWTFWTGFEQRAFPVCDPGHSRAPARSSKHKLDPSPEEAGERRTDQPWYVVFNQKKTGKRTDLTLNFIFLREHEVEKQTVKKRLAEVSPLIQLE